MRINMKRHSVPILSAVTLLCAASIANAKTDLMNSMSPYVGADAQVRHVSRPSNFGGNLYKSDNLQGTLFGGVQVNRYVGVEAGYSVTPFKESKTLILNGQTIFGNTVVAGTPPFAVNQPAFAFSSKWQIKDWHVDILGYLPVSEEHKLELVAGVGLARTKIFQSTIFLGSPAAAAPPFNFNRTFIAEKSLLRLTGGVQHMV